MSQSDDEVSPATEESAPEPEPVPLHEPADGVPALSVYTRDIAAAAELLASGTGPFAVDAERASGFRYSNRAYLIQIRRAGAGTVLIDPVSHGGDPLTVLAPVAEVLGTDQWILLNRGLVKEQETADGRRSDVSAETGMRAAYRQWKKLMTA